MAARSDIMAGKSYVELYVKNSQFVKALDNAKKQLTAFGQSIVGIGTKMMGVGTVITGSLAMAVRHFASVGDELDKMSKRTGIAADALAELGFAAEQSGQNLGAVEASVRKMQKTIGDAVSTGGRAAQSLEELGTSAARLQEMKPDEQFQDIADRIGAMEDPTRRAAVAMNIFGRSGTQLLPMIEDMRELRQEARDLGIAPSPESVAAAAEITDAINRVRRVIGAAIFEIGASLAPMAKDVLAAFQGVASGVRKFITENRSLIVTAAKVGAVVTAAGAAIVGIGTAFIGAGLAAGVVAAAIKGVVAAVVMVKAVIGVFAALATPILLIPLAIGAAVAAWMYFTQSGRNAASAVSDAFSGFVRRLKSYFAELRKTVGDTFDGVRDAILSGDLELAGQIAMTGLRMIFLQGWNAISSIFSGEMADIIGTFGSKIAGGDFSGAWATVVLGMSDIWASFSAGIASVFTTAARAVLNIWKTTVDGITNYILQQAAKGGVIGWLIEKSTGVNVKEEVERNNRLKAQAAAMGLDSGPDIFDQVAGGTYSDPATAAIADRLREELNDIERESLEGLVASKKALAAGTTGGGTAASEEYERLKGELAELQKKAAESRDAMKKASASKDPGEEGGGSLGASSPKSIATFSAAAAVAMSRGGGGQDIALRQLTAQEKLLDKTDKLIAKVSALGLHHA